MFYVLELDILIGQQSSKHDIDSLTFAVSLCACQARTGQQYCLSHTATYISVNLKTPKQVKALVKIMMVTITNT